MGYYVKYGHQFIKRTRNRRINTIDAILGTKKQAKIYGSERDAKKAITTYKFAYKELDGNCQIVPAKIIGRSTKKTSANTKDKESL
ncbi:MAG: hypothetical protein AB8E82_04600 [Aureispira sp.]